jgi:hypothetical protein
MILNKGNTCTKHDFGINISASMEGEKYNFS